MCGGSRITEDVVAVDQAISAELRAAKIKEEKIYKLLLLGAGESGKSTVFKQMKILHGCGYSNKDLRFFKPVLQSTIISDVQQLLRAINIPAVRQALCGDGQIQINDSLQSDMDEMALWRFGDSELTDERGQVIARIWASTLVKKVWEQRHLFHLSESAQFFLDKIEEVCQSNWLPTVEDVIRSRVRSVGVIDQDFVMSDGSAFRIVDVGGQRSERRKWIHSFSNVTAVLFITAISEYDQKCWEVSRVQESLAIFEDILLSPALKQASVIVFLNKTDLFKEKLARSPISSYIPEYVGDGTFEDAASFMKGLFMSVGNKVSSLTGTKRILYFHFTTATDKNNVEKVFLDSKSTVLQAALKNAQLI